MYYPSMKKEFTKVDSTSEFMSMKGETKNKDREFWETLTSGTGPLVPGALPSLDVQGEKSMADSLAGGSSSKAKARKGKGSNAEQADRVTPTTPKEFLV